jgi:hypothetical protein
VGTGTPGAVALSSGGSARQPRAAKGGDTNTPFKVALLGLTPTISPPSWALWDSWRCPWLQVPAILRSRRRPSAWPLPIVAALRRRASMSARVQLAGRGSSQPGSG